jgi:hypothetical protein
MVRHTVLWLALLFRNAKEDCLVFQLNPANLHLMVAQDEHANHVICVLSLAMETLIFNIYLLLGARWPPSFLNVFK